MDGKQLQGFCVGIPSSEHESVDVRVGVGGEYNKTTTPKEKERTWVSHEQTWSDSPAQTSIGQVGIGPWGPWQ